MRHFKNKKNKIFAVESNGSQDSIIKDDWTEITDKERNEILAPLPPTIDEQIATIEMTITLQDFRQAVLGNQSVLAKIAEVENQIAALRG